ncbi:hypothetical protein CERSUDRAFT_110666 [Gelatoporia subvermispora B]|uniref:BRCT domain-containing protein n=1 Tax=Ceriporiopsis subvermispora (strain B) TaxID=914234 RepID=M2QYA3_CERS8|nr:hypothetical protein CERSUDRAFT_110666 [Gelatoporia subvermispora B]
MNASASPGPALPHPVQAHPHLFLDQAGQPFQVFVEASGITFRPKLIRLLRNGGAAICLSPNHAHIILVDPVSDEGQKFIADWAAVPEKIVLDAIWVRRSAERGRVYLADEGWGGFLLSSANAAAPGVTNGVGHQSPLPTPRQTPFEAGPSVNGSVLSNFRAYTQQSASGESISSVQRTLTTGSTQPHIAVNTGQTIVVPQGFTPADQAVSQSAIPPEVLALLQDLGRQMTASTQNQGSQYPLHLSQPFVHGQFVPDANIVPSSYMVQNRMSNASNVPSSVSAESRDVSHSSVTPGDNRRSYTPPMDSFTSHKRNRSDIETSAHSRQKGKGRESPEPRPAKIGRRYSVSSERATPEFTTPPSFQRRPSAYTSQGGNNLFVEDGRALNFVVQIDTRNRKEIIQTVKAGGGKIIADIDKADYVVLNPNSHSFRQLLERAENFQKHAVNAQFVFDCAEEQTLVEPDGYGFGGHVSKPKANRGRPSSSISSPSGKSKKSMTEADIRAASTRTSKSSSQRASKTTTVKTQKDREKVARRSSEKERSDPEPSKPKAKRAKEKSTEDTEFRYSDLSRHALLPDEPSPPPPDKIVRYVEGKNLYSQEDRDYFLRYLLILLRRDPDLTNFAIAEKMHKKMPHHSLASWNAFMGHKKIEMEAARKKAMIAWRKAIQEQRRAQQASDMESSRETPVQSMDISSRTPSTPALPRKTDFELLAEFLAGGGADTRSDDEVWEEMGRLHPSRTATGWRALWDEQGVEINEAVQKLTEAQKRNTAKQRPISSGTFVKSEIE